jgi:hypothetical protein
MVFLAVEVPTEYVDTLMALISTGYNVQFPLILPKDRAEGLRKEWQKFMTGPAEHIQITTETEEVT